MDIDGAKSLETPDSKVTTGESVQDSYNVEDRGRVSPEHGEQPEDGSSHSELVEINIKDRRRAKSLSVFTDQHAFYETICPETCRKRVKFADTLGLNLASIKHFSSTEDPQIPSNVLLRLQSCPPRLDRDYLGDLCDRFTSTLHTERLVPAFQLPVDSKYFDSRVLRLRVALEAVTVTRFDIRGLIRALTGCSGNEVGVRLTFNNWLSFVDVQAIPTPVEDNAAPGDQFSFTVYTPPFLDVNSSVHFAVYFRTEQGEFWDNNEGHNYTLRYNCSSNESEAFHAT